MFILFTFVRGVMVWLWDQYMSVFGYTGVLVELLHVNHHSVVLPSLYPSRKQGLRPNSQIHCTKVFTAPTWQTWMKLGFFIMKKKVSSESFSEWIIPTLTKMFVRTVPYAGCTKILVSSPHQVAATRAGRGGGLFSMTTVCITSSTQQWVPVISP